MDNKIELEPTYCVKCGTKDGMKISKHIIKFNKDSWHELDKKVKLLLHLGAVFLSFSKEGIHIGMDPTQKEDK